MSAQLKATLQALLVTFLWSTSWVLIKLGLTELPALPFAGLRYTLAALCLLPFALHPEARRALRHLPRRDWLSLAALGVLYYAVTQGSQYLGLAYLPAVTVSLLLNFTALAVAWLGMLFLDERPSRVQWAGVALFTLGVLIYFAPSSLPLQQIGGVIIVLVGVLSNAGAAVLGRAINRRAGIPPLLVTIVSMSIGALLLLAGGVVVQGLPRLTWQHVGIITWLAVVNTAFAFTLWNHTQRSLTAMQSTLINSTMLVQIAVLAWLFLGESLSALELSGMALVAAGAVLVQLRPRGQT